MAVVVARKSEVVTSKLWRPLLLPPAPPWNSIASGHRTGGRILSFLFLFLPFSGCVERLSYKSRDRVGRQESPPGDRRRAHVQNPSLTNSSAVALAVSYALLGIEACMQEEQRRREARPEREARGVRSARRWRRSPPSQTAD